jgi:hypothetical protein
LRQHSPVLTGRYRASHVLFADGVAVDPEKATDTAANEWVFISTVPYARKIERGQSSKAAMACMSRSRPSHVSGSAIWRRSVLRFARSRAAQAISASGHRRQDRAGASAMKRDARLAAAAAGNRYSDEMTWRVPQ